MRRGGATSVHRSVKRVAEVQEDAVIVSGAARVTRPAPALSERHWKSATVFNVQKIVLKHSVKL